MYVNKALKRSWRI